MKLESLDLDGVQGPAFTLTLNGVFSENWQNNPTLETARLGGQNDGFIILLQSIKLLNSKLRLTCLLNVSCVYRCPVSISIWQDSF